MKKLIALAAVFAVVLSMTCISVSASSGDPSCDAKYYSSNHYIKAWITVPGKTSNYQYWIGVELWNDTGRYPDCDKIKQGKYTLYTFSETQTAKSGSNKNSTKGYAVMRLLDDGGNPVKSGSRKGQYYK